MDSAIVPGTSSKIIEQHPTYYTLWWGDEPDEEGKYMRSGVKLTHAVSIEEVQRVRAGYVQGKNLYWLCQWMRHRIVSLSRMVFLLWFRMGHFLIFR